MATSMAPLAQMIMELGRTGEKMQESFQRGREMRRAEEDRQLQRRKIEMGIEQDEQMFPYELEAARREAAMAGQPKMTSQARQVQELVNEGLPRSVAVSTVYGSERTYTDPQTGNIVSYNPLEAYFTELGAKTPEQQAQAAEIMDAEERGEIETVDTMAGQPPPPAVPPGGRILAEGTKEEERRAEQEEKEYKRTRELQQDTRSYSQELAKENIPQVEAQLNKIDEKIRGLAPEDIPGIGPGKKLFAEGGLISDVLNEIPIAGEALSKVTPLVNKFLLTDEGKEMQMLAQQVTNDYIKSMAGAAVSGSEEDRMLKALGQTNWSDPKEFLIGLEYIRRLTEAKKRNIQAGYGEEVVSEYEKNLQKIREDKEGDTKGFSPAKAEQVADNPETGETLYKYKGQWVDAQGKPYQPQNNAGRGQTASSPEQQQQPTKGASPEQQNPVQQAVGILQKELDSGVSKEAIKKRVDTMKANKEITQPQYRQIMRELQLGTYDVQAQRSGRGRGQRGGGTR